MSTLGVVTDAPRQHPLLVIEQLASQCTELHEMRSICEQICSRLAALTTHLETQDFSNNSNAISSITGGSAWSARADTLIARLSRLVDRNVRNNTVRRLTDVQRLSELYDLQVDIDAAVRASRAEHVDPARKWHAQWVSDVEAAEQMLERAALDGDVLRRELSASDNAQREALTLVKFAAANLSDTSLTSNDCDASDGDSNEVAKYRAHRLRVFKQLFQLLLGGIVAVAVPAVPEWFISPNDVAVRSGRAALSVTADADVRLGDWLPVAKTVVVKQLTDCNAAMREAALWYPLTHVNVLKLVGGCAVSTPPFVVYEALEIDAQPLDAFLIARAASVASRTSTAQYTSSSRVSVFNVLAQVAQALLYLHTQHALVHGDVRCRNVFVSADGRAKLCSFAQAASISDDATTSTPQQPRVLHSSSSLRWAAPESLEQAVGSLTFAADVYSFGMCILEATTDGDVPWGFTDDTTIRMRVAAGDLPPRDSSDKVVDSDVYTLVTAMCAHDPSARPALADVAASLEEFAVRERQQIRDALASAARALRSDAATATATATATASVQSSQSQLRTSTSSVEYDEYRRRLSFQSHNGGAATSSLSDAKSVVSDTSSAPSKDELRASTDAVNVVTLRLQWLGVKINSIGAKIVVSKFLRASSGVVGEIEASDVVALGDVIVAVNNQSTRGLDRHALGALIQRTPRPLTLSFRRESALLNDALQFRGLAVDARSRDRGAAVLLPGALDRVLGGPASAFSFELWFALADNPESYIGGILFGAQDVAAGDAAWAYVHKQLIVVDRHGNLCVSLLNKSDTPALIARELSLNIWYHLVVTYSDQHLAVYLDGELRHSATSTLHRDWSRLAHANIGSGCISGLASAKPTPDFTGWYGFNGLVHDMNVWRRTQLSDVAVQQLFRGARDCVDIPSYSLRRDALRKFKRRPSSHSSAQLLLVPERVRASQPQHVVAQVY